MKSFKKIFVNAVSYFFILLFIYASVSKLLAFENFQVQIAQSPLLSAYAGFVSYAVITVELLIVFLLFFHKYRLVGMYSSLGIMSAFTAYIYIIINYSESLPCSCGGILEKLGWNEHLIFNFICVLLAIIAIILGNVIKFTKKLSFIGATIVIPTLVLILLFYPRINDNQGNFTRKIINPFTKKPNVLELPVDRYYFAGNRGDTLFLGYRKTPLLLSTIMPSFNFVKVDSIRLDNFNYQFRNVSINVLYPYFSISDGKVPVIFEGKLPALNAYDTGINRLYFSRLCIMEPKKYVFKTMLVKTRKSELGILNSSSKNYVLAPEVLKTKADGIFDVDGNMIIDHKNHQIIYTLLYQNQTITTDFNLENIQRHYTLLDLSLTDTIKTTTLNNGETKLLKAPLIINIAQTASNNKFYNVSKVRGKDESFFKFRKNDVIDVYDLSTKRYLYSFYIKNDRRNKITSILSTKHYLYVLSGKKISRYTFK
ncbi:MauE/DoxX family redox-associated membrane protein [Chryseobacterium sp. TY4]